MSSPVWKARPSKTYSCWFCVMMKGLNLASAVIQILCHFFAASTAEAVCRSDLKEDSCELKTRPKETAEYGTIMLQSLFVDGEPDPSLVDVPKIIFIESSGRNFLQTRQACAVESAAAAHIDKDFLIVVVMTSNNLTVTANNATKQIYEKYGGRNIQFRTVKLKEAISGTELYKENIVANVLNSEKRIVHTSDVLRLALLYKFGGWYSDIDTVIMKPLTDFDTKFGYKEDNLVSTDQFGSHMEGALDANGHQMLGESVANGFFRTKSKSEFLEKAIKYFIHTFDNRGWSTGGAKPMTLALKEICGLNLNVNFITEGGLFDPSRCPNIRIVHPKYIFPLPWHAGIKLYENENTSKEWFDLLAESYSVDFYHSSLGNSQKIMRPKFYGKKLPAYAVLGPKYCPLSFFSERMF